MTERECGERLSVRLLSFAAQISSDCPEVLQGLADLYGPAGATEVPTLSAPAVHFNVRRRGVRYEVRESDQWAAMFERAADAVVHLEQLVNQAATAGLAEYLLVHAGAVAVNGQGIIIPAASGAGKSTLVAGLSCAGFRYLSDDVAVVDLRSRSMLPFLKALCLKEGGWQVVAATSDAPRAVLHGTRVDHKRVHFMVAPTPLPADGRVPIRFVLVPQRRAGAVATLVPLRRATALVQLAQHTLNSARHGMRAVEVLARVVAGADCYTLTYDRLSDAVEAVSTLVGHTVAQGDAESPLTSSNTTSRRETSRA